MSDGDSSDGRLLEGKMVWLELGFTEGIWSKERLRIDVRTESQ